MPTTQNIIRSIFLIGIGGGIGSILRYLTFVIVSKYCPTVIPFSAITVNVIGSLLIGIGLGLILRSELSNDLQLLLITGVLGGYTTFSTFSIENIKLLQSGNYITALIYISITIIAGLSATGVGFALAKA